MAGAPDHDPRSDLQLVEQINRGDAGAFEALYRRHRDYVARLAFRFTRDHDLSLDVTQETFIYLLGKFPGFRLSAKMQTFLYPVVKHTALAALRKRRRMTPFGDAAPDQPDPAVPPGPGSAEPPRQALGRIVAALPERHREVVLMRFVDDLSLAEIAEALGVPVGTVKSRLHNALRRLRDDPATQKYFEP